MDLAVPHLMKFDLLLAGVVALFGLFGLASGAISQLRHWAGLILAALAARPLSARLTPYAAPRLGFPPAAVNVALSVLLFFVLYVLAAAAARGAMRRFFPGAQNGPGDRAFGFALGAAKGAALLFVLLSLLIYFENPLTKAFGAPPELVRGSRAVALARRHDLFDAVPAPVLKKVEDLIAAAKDPKGLKALEDRPELRRLLDDPQLKAALQGGELSQALRSGDLSALKNDPRLKALLDDPRLAAPAAGAPGP
jgi:membrane protein required for colicin V production